MSGIFLEVSLCACVMLSVHCMLHVKAVSTQAGSLHTCNLRARSKPPVNGKRFISLKPSLLCHLPSGPYAIGTPNAATMAELPDQISAIGAMVAALGVPIAYGPEGKRDGPHACLA